MFKRILKVIGFVLLGFVVVIGAVIGFMAIRGDFKEKEIPPTSLSFSVEDSEILFDVQSEVTAGRKIYTFTILAEPADVNQLECSVEPNYPGLIRFVEWVNGKWEYYKSNKFFINKPISFVLEDITDANVGDYFDGVLKFKVIDSSNMLNATLTYMIDRTVTSIAIKDAGKPENNQIVNGLFAMDDGKYNGETIQYLEAVQGEDYPLEIITAPLKANKPFENKDAKITELFLLDEYGEPEMVVYNEEEDKVQLGYYQNQGLAYKDCEFLTYDRENDRFIFNSQNSGKYVFKLATYATYDIQQNILAQIEGDEETAGISFIDRLNLDDPTYKMLTKVVEITVSGTDAQNINFTGGATSIGLKLLQNNTIWVNNPEEAHNLGLKLTKASSGTEITGRYSELEFLDNIGDDTSFTNNIEWSFKVAKTIRVEGVDKLSRDGMGNVQYEDRRLEISIYDENGIKATVKNLPELEDYVYDAKLIGSTLTLTTSVPDNSNTPSDPSNPVANNKTIILTMVFDADKHTQRFLTANKTDIDGASLTQITLKTDNGDRNYYVDTLGAGKMIADDNPAGTEREFKFLKSFNVDGKGGMYLAILGKRKSDDLTYSLINDKFITSIVRGEGNGQIQIKPIDGELDLDPSDPSKGYYDIQIYAVIVNADGSCYFTPSSRKIVVNKVKTDVAIDNAEQKLPINVKVDSIEYSTDGGISVSEFVSLANSNGSYNGIALFVNPYRVVETPEVIEGLYTYDETTKAYVVVEAGAQPVAGETYYKKVSNIKYIEDFVIYGVEGYPMYLVGEIVDNKFVNAVKLTDKAENLKLYPVVIETTYNLDYDRLNEVEEYISELYATQNFNLEYDLKSTPITLNTYYNVSKLTEEGVFKGVIGGNYFADNHDGSINAEGDYCVIPGHQSETTKWPTSGDVIGSGEIYLDLQYSHPYASVFTKDLINGLTIEPRVYDANGEFVKVQDEHITINRPTEVIIARDELYNTYMVLFRCKLIVGEHLKLSDNQYIMFDWVYEEETIATSEKLYILSRDLDEYRLIDLYTAGGTKYTGSVKIKVEVGHSSGVYNYSLYAVTAAGELLYKDSNATQLAESQVSSSVFKLVNNSGWIVPEPFYSVGTEFDVEASGGIIVDTSGAIKSISGAIDPSFKIVNKNNDAKMLTIGAVVDTSKFNYTGAKTYSSDSESYTISGVYTYNNGTDITGDLNVTISEIDAGDLTANYEVSQDGLNVVLSQDPTKKVITLSESDNTWIVSRSSLTAMTITLRVISVLGEHTIQVQFSSPYSIVKNSNPTTTIYSGTSFVLATTNPNDTETLWKLLLTTASNTVGLGIADTDNLATRTVSGGYTEWVYTVPDTNVVKEQIFTVEYYNGATHEPVDSIQINIAPNLLIMSKIEPLYELDDNENKEHVLTNIIVRKYRTGVYREYTNDDLDDPITGLKYSVNTYLDENFQTLSLENVAEESAGKLIVKGPISVKRDYYVQVEIKDPTNTIVVGSIKFKVTNKTDVSNAQNIEITANGTTVKTQANTYTLEDLANLFKLSQGNEASSLSLNDIFWLNYQNVDLSVKYTYGSTELIQKVTKNASGDYVQWLTYDDIDYKLISDGQYIKDMSGKVYYARLFENDSNVIALVVDRVEGKEIYSAELKNGSYELTSPVNLGALTNITFVYNNFGNPKTETNIADIITYQAELIFNNIVIVNNNKYSINVKPYTIMPTAANLNVYSGKLYTLYNPTAGANDLFKIQSTEDKANITGISFRVDKDNMAIIGTEGDVKTIIFKANGNSYNVDIPVTITYEDGSNFTYNVTFSVTNDAVVNINYPYNVDKTSNPTEYAQFTTVIDGITLSMVSDNIESIWADWAKTLGVEQTTGFEQTTRVQYDIALPGDTIYLAENDNLHNIERYKATSVLGKTYPIGDIQLVATSSTYDDVDYINTYIKYNDGSITISEAITNPGYILFKVYAKGSGYFEGDNESAQTGAYNYYLLQVVTNNLSGRIVYDIVGRKTYSKEVVVGTSNDKTIYSEIDSALIKLAIPSIEENLINTSKDNLYLFMVDSDDGSEDHADVMLGGKKYNEGDYIPQSATFPAISDGILKTVTVAVVVKYNGSPVHVCNIELILQPNIEITPGGKIEKTDSDRAKYYIYETTINYTRSTGVEVINLSSSEYFTVKNGDGNLGLTSVSFVTDETTLEDTINPYITNNTDNANDILHKAYADGITADMTEAKRNAHINSYTIASINNTKLEMKKAVSQSGVYFYLALTYTDGSDSVVIYLKVNLTKYTPNAVTNASIGGAESDNTYYLESLFGKYKGKYNYTITYNGIPEQSGDEQTSDGIVFNNVYSTATKDLKIKFVDVVPSIERTISITVAPNISYTHASIANNGESASTSAALDLIDSSRFSLAGSELDISLSLSGNILKVANEKSSELLKINVKSDTWDKIKFELTDKDDKQLKQDDQILKYFVSGGAAASSVEFTKAALSSAQTLQFVHSAADVNLRLKITIMNIGDAKAYNTYTLFVTLPKTYELSATYRVQGAIFETKVDGTELDTIKGGNTSKTYPTSVNNHFLGTDGDYPSVSGINQSRLGIKLLVDETLKSGYDNLVTLGLLDELNPNRIYLKETNRDGTKDLPVNEAIKFSLSTGDIKLNIRNALGVNVDYNIQVYSEERDYGKFILNDNLVSMATADPNVVTVSIPYNDLSKVAIGYLNYLPNSENGIVGFVTATVDSGTIDFKTIQYVGSEYGASVVVNKNGLNKDLANTITLKIITINGLYQTTYNLVVADVSVVYGYGDAYENAYSGYDLGKLSENLQDRVNGSQRVKVKLNGSEAEIGSDVGDIEFQYYGAYNGHGNCEGEPDYDDGDKSLVYFENDIIKTRNVNMTTNITMVFYINKIITPDPSKTVATLGRIEYKISLLNGLYIKSSGGLYENDAKIDLYIGSTGDAYTYDGNITEVNLLSKAAGNNLYLELYDKQFQAGVAQDILKPLNANNAANWLAFEVTDKDWLGSDEDVSVDPNGTLKVKGNPSGGYITLKVAVKDSPGVGAAIKVNLNKFDRTIDQYKNGNSITWKSGDIIELFATGNGSLPLATAAFVVQRQGYKMEGGKHSVNLTSVDSYDANKLGIACEVRVFDSSATNSEMKKPSNWNGPDIDQNLVSKIKVQNSDSVSVQLPQVLYSTSDATIYQYVVYRLSVTYNGDTDYYYAIYKVTNDQTIEVNSKYKDDKTIVFSAGAAGTSAWTVGNSGAQDLLIVMANSGHGLYKANPNSYLYSDPDNYILKMTYTDPRTGTSKTITRYLWEIASGGAQSYLNNVGSHDSNLSIINAADIRIVIQLEAGALHEMNKQSVKPIEGTYYTEYGDVLTGQTLTNYQGDIYSIDTTPISGSPDFENKLYAVKAGTAYRRVTGLEVIVDETWTFKGNDAINANQSVRLDTFFLRSEIPQLYQDYEVVGLLKSISDPPSLSGDEKDTLKSFVGNANADPSTATRLAELGDYELYEITYVGSSSSKVCKVESKYCVLVGKDSAMSLQLTADYISLIIDEDNIKNNEAIINILDYIKIHNNANFTTGATPTAISVTETDGDPLSGDINYINTATGSYKKGDIILKNVNARTSNYSYTVRITSTGADTIYRDIQLYFNIIINAQEYDSNGMLKYNNEVAESVGKNNGLELTAEGSLKETLLKLISHSGIKITDNNVGNYAELYTVTVTPKDDCYEITYVYNATYTTYTRTFKMKAGIKLKSTSYDEDGYLFEEDCQLAIMDATVGVGSVSIKGNTFGTLSDDLWDLVITDHNTDVSNQTVDILVVKADGAVIEYIVTYSYKHTEGAGANAVATTYSRTFKMRAGINNNDGVYEGDGYITTSNVLVTAMTGKESLVITATDSSLSALSTNLWSLVEAISPDGNSKVINVKAIEDSTGAVVGYELKYSYTYTTGSGPSAVTTTYSRTFKMLVPQT